MRPMTRRLLIPLALLALGACSGEARAVIRRDCESRLGWARSWADSSVALDQWNLSGFTFARCSEVLPPPLTVERPDTTRPDR